MKLSENSDFSRKSSIQFYSKVNNVFCLSLLGLLDSSYGSIPARARSDRNVLGGSHGLPPHSSMYRYTNSGRSSLRPFYSSFSVNDLKVLKVLKVWSIRVWEVSRTLRWHSRQAL